MPNLGDYPAPYALSPDTADYVRKGMAALDQPAPAPAAPQPDELPPNGILTDIGHGLMRGAEVGVPEMAGGVLQAFSPETSSLYAAGAAWRAAAKARESRPDLRVTGAWGAGAESVAPSLAALGVAAPLALAGAPAAAVGLAGGATAALLFGGSSYTDTKEQALQAGASPDQAESAGIKAGITMGAGQAAAAAVGGRILAGVGGKLLPSFLRKAGTENAIQSWDNPGIFHHFAKNFAELMGVQEVVQPGTAAIMNQIQQDAGIDTKQSNWEAAKASFAPTAAMTTLLAPVGIIGAVKTAAQRRGVANSVSGRMYTPEDMNTDATKTARLDHAQIMAEEMAKSAPLQEVKKWQGEANAAINAGKPVEMHAGFEFDNSTPVEYGEAQAKLDNTPDYAAAQHELENRPEEPNYEAAQRQLENTPEEINYEGAQSKLEAPDYAAAQADLDRRENPRLPAPKPPEAPAIALPDANKVPEQAYPPTKEGETKYIRAVYELPSSTPGPVIDKLRGLNHDEKQGLDELAKIYDPTKDTKWMEAVRDTLKKAGRLDDEGNPRENTAANRTSEAPAENRQGTEPQPAAVQTVAEAAPRTEQMVKAQRNAKSGREAGAVAQANTKPGLSGRAIARALQGEAPMTLEEAKKEAEFMRQQGAGEHVIVPHPEGGYGVVSEHIDDARPRQPEDDPNATPGPPAGSHDPDYPNVIDQPTAADAAKALGNEPPEPAAVFPTPTGEDHATATGQTERGNEHQNGGVGGQAPSAGDSNSALQGTQGGAEAVAKEAQRKVTADTLYKAELRGAKSSAKRAHGDLAAYDSVIRKAQDALRDLQTRQQEAPTNELYAKIAKMQRAVEQLVSGRKEIHKKALDADSQLQKVVDREGEPAHTAGNALYMRPGALEQNNHADTLSFLAGRKLVGERLTQDESALLRGRAPEKRDQRAKEEAKLAFKDMPAAEKTRWQARVEQLVRATKTAAEMRAVTKAAEAEAREKVNQKVRQEVADNAEDEAKLEAIDEDVKGWVKVTNETGTHWVVEGREKEVLNAMAASIDRKADLNRGLAALSEKPLGVKVAETPHATAIMEHIAKTHANPLMRVVAKMLAKAQPNAHIVEIPGASFNGGRYVPSSHTIEIGRGGMNPITLMHETVHSLAHAALYRAMDNISRPLAELHPQAAREVEALKTIRATMDKFAEVADVTREDHRLALENEHEFLSEALNNPHIQELLGGKRGWLKEMWDKVRSALFGTEIKQSDFEKLMEVTPALFGDPKRSSTEIFNSALARAPEGSPPSFITKMTDALTKGAIFSAKARGVNVKGTKLKGLDFILKATTVNNQHHMLTNYIEAMKKDLSGKHAALIESATSIMALRDVEGRQSADGQHLRNAPGEGNDQIRRLAKFVHESPKEAVELMELLQRTRDAEVFPADTFDEAKARNPKMTREMYDAPLATETRAKYKAMMARDGARTAADPKALTASHIYASMNTYHELHLRRIAMTNLAAMRHVWGMAVDPKLDWKVHAFNKDNRLEEDPAVQLKKVKDAVAISRAATLAEIKNAGIDPESEMGKNVTSFQTASEHMLSEIDRQASVPYTPRTRPGKFFIHVEIADKPGLYDRVRAIVHPDANNRNPDEGGLGRDMGPKMPGGSNVVRMHFENLEQLQYAESRFAALRKEGAFKIQGEGEAEAKDTYAAGSVIGNDKPYEGASPGWIKAFEKRIDNNADWDAQVKLDMKNEVRQAYINSLSEMNPLKSMRHADKSAGASRDMVASYGDRLERGATQLAALRASNSMGKAINRLNTAMDVANHELPSEVSTKLNAFAESARQRVADKKIAVNTPIRDTMRAIAAPFRLALSPAYLMMTAYQPWQMTLPWLGGKHGYMKSAAAMARHYGTAHAIMTASIKNAWESSSGTSKFQKAVDAANPAAYFSNVKDAQGNFLFHGAELEAINRLGNSNLTSFGQYNQIWRPQTTEGVEAATGTLKQINRLASVFPHYVEMSNRIVAYMAAHELYLTKDLKRGATKEERSAVMDKATPEERKAAQEYAIGMIRDTDGDHSQGNIARMFGRRGFLGGSTPLVIGFGQYDLQMTESLIRTIATAIGKGDIKSTGSKVALKQMAGVLAMTSLMAGTLGMPFMGLMTGLWNRIGALAQDDEDQPPDFEKSWKDGMSNIFGEKGGEIVSRGLPHLLDFDMSQRSGYQDLAPFTSFLTDRQKIGDTINSQALNFLGPAVGVGVGMATGAAAAIRGNWPQAINDALPAFARNAAKSYRLSQYGYERQSDGNASIPLPVSTWNVIAQAGGFGSAAKAEEGERQRAFNDNQKIMQQRIEIIRNKWLRAQDHGDSAAIGEAMQELIGVAAANPQYAGAPASAGSALRQRAQAREMAKLTGGVAVSRRALPFYQQFQNQGGLPTFDQ